MENHIYFLTANRVGHERGFDFIGQSKICNCSGAVLASANLREETIIYGDVDPLVARNKHIVRVPGKHHIDRFADRRPDLYGPLFARLEKRTSPG
jgi:predicted amidohydrolase